MHNDKFLRYILLKGDPIRTSDADVYVPLYGSGSGMMISMRILVKVSFLVELPTGKEKTYSC